MRSLVLTFVLSLLLLASASMDDQYSDYEIWLDGRYITLNVTIPDVQLNETLCMAEAIKINKKMKELDFLNLECATKVKTVTVGSIGLERIADLDVLPLSVRNLTIVGNNVRKINSGTFSNLTFEYLNLSSNKIQEIESDAFDYMKNVATIILDHNEITVFDIKFLECPKLKLISLKHNFIKELSERTLQHLKHNVLTIFLSYNNIKEVHKSALDIKQFHEVHLDHNELTNAQLLIKLVKAEKVDLSENRITCLPKEFMENGLSKIKMLNLTGNPLECSCLQDLQRKVRKNIEFQKMSPLVQNINIILPKNRTC